MRFSRFVFLIVVLTFARSATAQQATASAFEATALLQKSLVALSGDHLLTDVTLSGTARRIAGSDDESGTVVVKALARTATRLDLSLPSGSRSEIRNTSSVPIIGSWSGPDGISHQISHHNLLADPGWAPAFTIASLLSAQDAVITNLGPETRNGQSVIHLSASQQFPAISGDTANLMQHLTRTDVYLDAATLLPSAIALNMHPDNNANLDIPTEIVFSNYTVINGAQIPLHIQKLINNSLALDLQFNSAVLNSGLSPTTFTVGAGL